ncbi:MAG TPA: hypothetical protein VGP05_22550 [Pseudonocardia sp.]|nr:hypothetical protein [Pseudonocardia sp.]
MNRPEVVSAQEWQTARNAREDSPPARRPDTTTSQIQIRDEY